MPQAHRLYLRRLPMHFLNIDAHYQFAVERHDDFHEHTPWFFYHKQSDRVTITGATRSHGQMIIAASNAANTPITSNSG